MLSNLLERSRAAGAPPTSYLNPTQMQQNQILDLAQQTMRDAPNLAAMTLGSFAFRFTKILSWKGLTLSGVTRFAPNFLLKSANNVMALTAEVSVFRSSNIFLHPGFTSGEEVFEDREWKQTFIDFAALKSIGYFMANTSSLLAYFSQANAMILGNVVSTQLGLLPHEQKSYINRLAEAQLLSFALGAGSALVGHFSARRLQYSIAFHDVSQNFARNSNPSQILVKQTEPVLEMAAQSRDGKRPRTKTPRLSLQDRIILGDFSGIIVEMFTVETAQSPNILRSDFLGPCIAIAVYDPITKTGHMMHEVDLRQSITFEEFMSRIRSHHTDLSTLKVFVTGNSNEYNLDDPDYFVGYRDYVRKKLEENFSPSQITSEWAAPNVVSELYLDTASGEFYVDHIDANRNSDTEY